MFTQQTMWIKVFCFITLFSIISAGWTSVSTQKEITAKAGEALDFKTSATEIRSEVFCSRTCNVYLLDLKNLSLLKSGSNFESFYKLLGTTYSKTSFSDQNLISKGVVVYVENPSNTTSLIGNIIQEQNIPDTGSGSGSGDTNAVLIALLVVFVIVPSAVTIIGGCISICAFMLPVGAYCCYFCCAIALSIFE